MCEISGVSRSGYYKYLKSDIRQISREESDLKDFQLIQEAYSYRGYDKGVVGIHMRLLHMGIRMNHKKIHGAISELDIFAHCILNSFHISRIYCTLYDIEIQMK